MHQRLPEALTGAVSGEFLAANRGVGYLVNSAAVQLNMAVSFAAILVLLLMVMAFDVGVSLLERRTSIGVSRRRTPPRWAEPA